MLRRFYHFIFHYLHYLPFVKKTNGRFTIISPILISYHSLILGKQVFIRNNARIEAVEWYNDKTYNPIIELNDNVSIEQNLHLTCANSIKIGANTSISANVTITDINHPYQNLDIAPEMQDIKVGSVEIGSNCKVYNNAVILPNVILGKHCVIGANSVVMAGTYKDYSIIAGAPAKVVKYYNFELGKWMRND